MRYTVTARYAGHTFAVTWEDGKLSGDPAAVHFLKFIAKIHGGYTIFGGPTLPLSAYHHLQNPVSTYKLMEKHFDKILDYSGDLLSLWQKQQWENQSDDEPYDKIY